MVVIKVFNEIYENKLAFLMYPRSNFAPILNNNLMRVTPWLQKLLKLKIFIYATIENTVTNISKYLL